jgi:Mg2+-importing ATPase
MMRYHITVKIITGDNFLVTQKIARELNFPVHGTLSGEEIAKMHDTELERRVEEVNIFARVNPEEKERIIKALRANGHVVGYLGDGVNDVLSLRAADVGISVNNAVDIAKETADIILVRKGLNEIIEGIIEGRKTFANIFKYLMMALSSNFGNMVSMPFASVFLPFLPMTATQILLNNFLYDGSQFAIPFDTVEESFLERAKKFDLQFMKKFMILFGPLSSFFDFITFGVLLMVFHYTNSLFQTGWFLESIATQTLVVNAIRSRKSFFDNRPNVPLLIGTVGIVGFSWLLPYTEIGRVFGLMPLPMLVLLSLMVIICAYFISVEFAKKIFYARWGHLIER